MRTLVHLSDIHFGRTDEHTVRALATAVRHAKPDIVAVSGDLTQRARRVEYEQARRFLQGLPTPQIVVPGNHDVPLHNVYARFAEPLARYREYVTADLEPFYSDEEIAVLGINTARSLVFKGGRINERQISRIEQRLGAAGAGVVKVLVTHHPFDLPDTFETRHLVGRAALAMATIAGCGIDILLAGHFHVTHSGPTAERYRSGRHSAIFVQAGTAASTRGRGEANAFNTISIRSHAIDIQTHTYAPGDGFRCIRTSGFRRTANGWARAVR